MELTEMLQEAVFRFLPFQERKKVLTGLLAGSEISLGRLRSLEKLAEEFHIDGEYEGRNQGPQALNHYAWAATALGNAAKKAGLHLPADEFYKKAWKGFVDPANRGHDDNGHRLIKENPHLFEDPEIRAHYSADAIHMQRLLQIAPELQNVPSAPAPLSYQRYF